MVNKNAFQSNSDHPRIRAFTSGHVTKMAVIPCDPSYPKTQNANLMALCFIIEPKLLPIEVVHCGITEIFDLLL